MKKSFVILQMLSNILCSYGQCFPRKFLSDILLHTLRCWYSFRNLPRPSLQPCFSRGLPPQYVLAATRQTVILSDRKSTRLNSSHVKISYAVFCLKKKNTNASS